MEPTNNAIQIYREGLDFTRMVYTQIPVTTKCFHSYQKLSQCVLNKKLNILNHDVIRAECQLDEWHAECPGAVRRNHIERIYIKGVGRRLYTQEGLNKYMEVKNNNQHYGIIDPRY